MRLWISLVALVCAGAIGRASACDESPSETLRRLARDAVSSEAAKAEAAIRTLRAAGPIGLEALLVEHAPIPEPVPAALRAALDAVGAQRDNHAARLFWHTDLEAAKAAARAAGKPILSLRLLGNLTDELSCANSRYFRAALYSNATVSRKLRDDFVLHWQSVRPVPIVTIDFGDGRKLEQTITGNSIHYVLDAEGRPVDAIPGLYGPRAFLRALDAACALALAVTAAPAAEREALIRSAHARSLASALEGWARDRKQIELGAAVQMPADRAGLEACTNDGHWKDIATLHAEDARLDEASVALIDEHGVVSAEEAARAAFSKSMYEDPLLKAIRSFESSMAVDSVRNEYLLHTRIHEWFAAGEPVTRDLDALNRRVYAELFLTPDTDPWLGLAPPGVYSGIRDATQGKVE